MAKQTVIDKYYPKYKEMGLAQRVKTDQLIQQKYGGMIAKLTMKNMKKVKKRKKKKLRRQESFETRCVNFTNKLVK